MKTRTGNTLVEFLLYIGIVTILLLVSSSLVFNLLDGKAKLQAFEEVSQNQRLALHRMELAIRNATNIMSPAQGATGTQLILRTGSVTTTFFLSSSTIQMAEQGVATTSLTASELTVSQLLFRNLSATSTPSTIRIQISASSTNPAADPDFSAAQPIYGSATVRRRP